MISRSTRLTAVAAVAALAAAAACSSSDDDGGGDRTTMEEESAESITFWHTGDEAQIPMLQAAGDLFEAEHGVAVEIEVIDWADAHTQLITAIQSGDGPDVFSGGLSWGIEFGELGGLINLRDYEIDTLEENVIPNLWSSIESADGSLYGVPLNMTTYIMFYRTDILEENNLEVPTTWDEMDNAIEVLQGAGYELPFIGSWEPIGWLDWFNYLHQGGGSPYSEDCSEVTVDSPEAVAGTEYWANRHLEQNVPTEGPDMAAGFESGDYVMATGGSWQFDVLTTGFPQLEGLWDMAPLPAGPGAAGSFIGGNIVGVMAGSEAPGTSAAFIDFMYTEEALGATLEAAESNGTLWLPPRIDTLAGTHLPESQQAVLTEIFETSVGPPSCPGWEAASSDVQLAIQSIVLEGASVEDGLAQAKAAMEATLR